MRRSTNSDRQEGQSTRWLYVLPVIIAIVVLGILIYLFATRPQSLQEIAETTGKSTTPAPSHTATTETLLAGSSSSATTAVNVATETATPNAQVIEIPDCLEPSMAIFIQPESVVIHATPRPTTETVIEVADPLAAVQPAGELLVHWTFDEGTGAEVADVSANGNSAMLSRADMLRTEAGHSGGALAFQYPEDALLVSEESPLDTILQAPFLQRTVALWAKADDVIAPQTLYEEGDSHNGLALRLKDGRLEARISTTIEGETLSAQADYPYLSAGEWQHIAAVFNSGVLALYLNGVLVDFVDDVPFAVVQAHTDPTVIGAAAGGNAFEDDIVPATFQGLLDDVHIFSTEFIEPLPAATVSDATPEPQSPTPTATAVTAPATATVTQTVTTAATQAPSPTSSVTLSPTPEATGTSTLPAPLSATPTATTVTAPATVAATSTVTATVTRSPTPTTGVILPPTPEATGTSTLPAPPSATPAATVVITPPAADVTDTPFPTAVVVPTAALPAPSGAIVGLPLLDLPFPYDGGNETFGGSPRLFRQVSQGVQNEGRITSYYDHLFPLYPAPQAGNATNGREPIDLPYGGQMLPFDGLLRKTGYSGHPGYDFAPFERGQATTPAFAAADGVVDDVAIHPASGAYYIEILHETEYGDYLTRYWHLEPDEYFEAMRERIGQPIQAGERIGTIGNTGWSTGHHLHFEVRCDCNGDGVFSLDETVDPFGFVPSAAFPEDPWEKAVTFVDGKGDTYFHPGSTSRYLWKYPVGVSALMPPGGGGQLTQYEGVGGEGGSVLCAPEGSIPAGSTVNWSWVADPPPSEGLAGSGHGCTLSVIRPDGTQVEHFAPSIQITIPFTAEDLANIDNPAETLAIYWQRPGIDEYERLETIVDLDAGLASAQTEYPGVCALLGLPNRDLVAPQTTITAEGPVLGNGAFSGPVTVSLSSADEDIAFTEYSVDGGYTWRPYTQPFSIPGDARSMGVPDNLGDEEGVEGLIRGPGRYLVLAYSRDLSGNEEYPAVAKIIYIEPQIPAKTPKPDIVVEPETAVCDVTADTLLRFGPELACQVLRSAPADEQLQIVGRNESGSWLQVQITNGRFGWIRADRCGQVPAVDVVPASSMPPKCVTPTPTPTITPTPTPEGVPPPPKSGSSGTEAPRPINTPFNPDPYPE